MSQILSAPPVAGPVVEADRPCSKCGYNLRGLPIAGTCPECGSPVASSLRGVLLRYADSAYVARIVLGLRLILWGILAQVLLGILGFAIGIAVGTGMGGGLGGLAFQQGYAVVGAMISMVLFLGYWRFTDADPSFTGLEEPNAARKVIRITAPIYIAAQIAIAALQFVGGAASAAAGGAGSPGALMVGFLLIGLTVIGTAVWAVEFFAMMRYVRWVAARLPDEAIMGKTRRYMWLLPVLTTVGIALIGLGPLIALILYWNLLDALRKRIVATRSEEPEAGLVAAV